MVKSHYRRPWRTMIRRSGLAEGYSISSCTLPLYLTPGSGFATDTVPKHRAILIYWRHGGKAPHIPNRGHGWICVGFCVFQFHPLCTRWTGRCVVPIGSMNILGQV
jgi:hypothetical protein